MWIIRKSYFFLHTNAFVFVWSQAVSSHFPSNFLILMQFWVSAPPGWSKMHLIFRTAQNKMIFHLTCEPVSECEGCSVRPDPGPLCVLVRASDPAVLRSRGSVQKPLDNRILILRGHTRQMRGLVSLKRVMPYAEYMYICNALNTWHLAWAAVHVSVSEYSL